MSKWYQHLIVLRIQFWIHFGFFFFDVQRSRFVTTSSRDKFIPWTKAPRLKLSSILYVSDCSEEEWDDEKKRLQNYKEIVCIKQVMFWDDGWRRMEEKGDSKIQETFTAHILINRSDA